MYYIFQPAVLLTPVRALFHSNSPFWLNYVMFIYLCNLCIFIVMFMYSYYMFTYDYPD